MTSAETDADDHPIHFAESYRRAKRNALFWAAATILIALGSAGAVNTVEVESVFKGLHYPPGMLTVASLLTLAFMFAGYVRAERRLLAQHSGFAYARRLKEAADAADHLAREIDGFRASIDHADTDLSVRRQEIIDAMAMAMSRLGDDTKPDGEIGRELVQYQLSPRQVPSEAEILTHGRNQIDLAVKIGNALLEQHRAKLLDRFREGKSEVERAFGNLEKWRTSSASRDVEIRNEIANAAAQFRGFAAAIGTGERWWFYTHDRAVVWVMSGLAVVLALFRLIRPETLAAAIQALF